MAMSNSERAEPMERHRLAGTSSEPLCNNSAHRGSALLVLKDVFAWGKKVPPDDCLQFGSYFIFHDPKNKNFRDAADSDIA